MKLCENGEGVVFSVRVVPGSSRTALAGTMAEMVKIKLSAPAEKGKANAALVDFLAEVLGVSKNAISIVSGRTGKTKQIRVEGLSSAQVRVKLAIK